MAWKQYDSNSYRNQKGCGSFLRLAVFNKSVLFKIREQDGFIEQNVWRFEV